MGTEIEFLTVLGALFAMFIGATIQFFFTRHVEYERHVLDRRTVAYIDYLRSVNGHANLWHDRDTQAGRELGARTADAKCRIGLYGSSSVIKDFIEFERLGATMNTRGQRESFIKMVETMRRDSLKKEDGIDLSDLETLVIGEGSKKRHI